MKYIPATIAATAAAALTTAGQAAAADGLRPASAHSLDLGPVKGVAHSTIDSKGFHVVATVSPTRTTKPIRLAAMLLPGQGVTVSLPLSGDGRESSVRIVRSGDGVRVRRGGPPSAAAE